MHGSFCIRGDHDQAFTGNAAFVFAFHVAVYFRSFEIIEIKMTEIVIGHLAGIIGRAAHRADGDQSVGSRTATGLIALEGIKLFELAAPGRESLPSG